MSTKDQNETKHQAPLDPSTQSELNELASLLQASGNEDDLSEANLARLISSLDRANGVANGIEGKLDAVIDNLDVLLAALEEKEKNKDQTQVNADARPS